MTKVIANVLKRLIAANKGLDSKTQQNILQEIQHLVHKFKVKDKEWLQGYCAAFSATLFLEKKVPAGFFPYSVQVGEYEHVILLNPKTQEVIDATGNQFHYPVFSWYTSDRYEHKRRLDARDLKIAYQEGLDLSKPEKITKVKSIRLNESQQKLVDSLIEIVGQPEIEGTRLSFTISKVERRKVVAFLEKKYKAERNTTVISNKPIFWYVVDKLMIWIDIDKIFVSKS